MTARPERKEYVFILTVLGKPQIFQLFIVCRSAKNGGKQRVKNIFIHPVNSEFRDTRY